MERDSESEDGFFIISSTKRPSNKPQRSSPNIPKLSSKFPSKFSSKTRQKSPPRSTQEDDFVLHATQTWSRQSSPDIIPLDALDVDVERTSSSQDHSIHRTPLKARSDNTSIMLSRQLVPDSPQPPSLHPSPSSQRPQPFQPPQSSQLPPTITNSRFRPAASAVLSPTSRPRPKSTPISSQEIPLPSPHTLPNNLPRAQMAMSTKKIQQLKPISERMMNPMVIEESEPEDIDALEAMTELERTPVKQNFTRKLIVVDLEDGVGDKLEDLSTIRRSTERKIHKEKGKEKKKEPSNDYAQCPICLEDFHVDEISHHVNQEMDCTQVEHEQELPIRKDKGKGRATETTDTDEELLRQQLTWSSPPPKNRSRDRASDSITAITTRESNDAADNIMMESDVDGDEVDTELELEGTESDKDVGRYISDLPPEKRAIYRAVLNDSSGNAREEWAQVGLVQVTVSKKSSKGGATKKWGATFRKQGRRSFRRRSKSKA